MKYLIALLMLISVNVSASVDKWFDYAAKEVGVDKTLLYTFAFKESSFRPRKSNNSSATGLFQFKEQTYRWLLYKYGNDYEGLAMDADINDLFTQTMLSAIYIRRNQASLKDYLKREPTMGETYMTHLLGLSGTKRLLGAKLDLPASTILTYAYSGNKKWFVTSSGKHRTVSQFRDNLNYHIKQIYGNFANNHSVDI